VMPLAQSGRSFAAYVAYSNNRSNLNVNSVNLNGGIDIIGNATIFGARYIIASTPATQQLSLGVDLKMMGKTKSTYPNQTVVLSSDRINYLPLSIAYTGQLLDRLGTTKLTASMRGNIAGVLPYGDKEAFGGNPLNPDYPSAQPGNRVGATGTFGVMQAGAERFVTLPEGFSLTLKIDGQLATEPLIPAEQYTAGGLDSVRGYVESETLGDNAVHWTAEIATPPFAKLLPASVAEELKLRLFYDAAYLWLKNAPAGQTDHFELEGMGLGVSLRLTEYVHVRVDQAWAFRTATVTRRGDAFTHFTAQVAF